MSKNSIRGDSESGPTLSLWQRLARHRLFDLAAVVLALVSAIRIVTLLPDVAWKNDFVHYYLGSRLLLEGHDPYTTPLAPLCAQEAFYFNPAIPVATNPPTLLWLFAPLAMTGRTAAFVIWNLVEVASLVGVLMLTRRLLGDRLSRRGWLFVCAAAVISAPVYWHFCCMQSQLLLAAMVLGAYAWHREGKPTAACLLLCAAGSLKLFPLLWLPWFCWRDAAGWRDRMRRVVLSAGLLAGIVGLTGVGHWVSFARHALPIVETMGLGLVSTTVPSLLAKAIGLVQEGAWLQTVTGVNWWMAVGAGFTVIAMAYGCCRLGSGDREAEFCLLTVAVLAGEVTTWSHYLVLGIFPLTVAVVRAGRTPGHRLFLVILWLLLSNDSVGWIVAGHWGLQVFDRIPYGEWIKLVCLFTPLAGLLMLGGFFAKELVKPISRQHPPVLHPMK